MACWLAATLCSAAIKSNVDSQQSLSQQQSSDFADALTNGISATLPPPSSTSKNKTSSSGRGKDDVVTTGQAAAAHAGPTVAPTDNMNRRLLRLQQQTDTPGAAQQQRQHAEHHDMPPTAVALASGAPSNATSTAAEAYTSLVDGAYMLNTVQAVTLGAAAKAAGNAGLCIAPALLPTKSAAGFGIKFDCPGINTPAEVRWLLKRHSCWERVHACAHTCMCRAPATDGRLLF